MLVYNGVVDFYKIGVVYFDNCGIMRRLDHDCNGSRAIPRPRLTLCGGRRVKGKNNMPVARKPRKLKPQKKSTNARRNLEIQGAGDFLRTLREKMGFSLTKMATLLESRGWDKFRLSRAENNHVRVPLELLERMASILGKSRNEMLLECMFKAFPECAEQEVIDALTEGPAIKE